MTETEAGDGYDGRTFPREDLDQAGGAQDAQDAHGGYGGHSGVDSAAAVGAGVGWAAEGISRQGAGAGLAAAGLFSEGQALEAWAVEGGRASEAGAVEGGQVSDAGGVEGGQALERVGVRLDQVEALPVAEHVGVFEEILTDLEQALGSVDE